MSKKLDVRKKRQECLRSKLCKRAGKALLGFPYPAQARKKIVTRHRRLVAQVIDSLEELAILERDFEDMKKKEKKKAKKKKKA